MVGGTVVEVSEVKSQPDVLYVNCADKPKGRCKADYCAIFVKKDGNAMRIEVGDALWWQGGRAFWTPQQNRVTEHEANQRGLKQGFNWDIPLVKIGCSGVKHPDAEVEGKA